MVCGLFVAADLSMLYMLYVAVLHVDPPVDLFVKLLDITSCVRPGLRTLYRFLLEQKEVKTPDVCVVREEAHIHTCLWWW